MISSPAITTRNSLADWYSKENADQKSIPDLILHTILRKFDSNDLPTFLESIDLQHAVTFVIEKY